MNTIHYVYPSGGDHAVTFSYDDGQVFDRRLVEIFNRHGMKATFHLNSGTFDKPGFITSAEVKALYEGHEVAAHSVTHPFLSQQPLETVLPELLDDRAALEKLVGKPVRGFSYPFGDFANGSPTCTRMAGLDYARTVESSHGFFSPDDFSLWHPTCHHSGAFDLLERFKREHSFHPLNLFYIWGHSFEFDRENNWELIENLCAQLAETPHIWAATNAEVMDYTLAMRNLRWSVDRRSVINPSAISVFARIGDGIKEILPGLNQGVE